MVKHLLTLSLALTLIWGCDGKKSETKTAETKTAEAKTVGQASSSAQASTTQQPTSKVGSLGTKGSAGDQKAAKAAAVKSLKEGLKNDPAVNGRFAAHNGPLTGKKGALADAKKAIGSSAASNVQVGPEALMDPSKAIATCPNTLIVKFETTKGDFKVLANRHWAPKGADRFYNLVKVGFFTDIAVFRVIKGFMAQFGIHGDPKVAAIWKNARIQDDKVNSQIASNSRGKLTFATAGPNTRSSQFFINFGDNARLDGMGFAPIGEVIEKGMDTVDTIYNGYGEGAPRGKGPAQGRVQTEGNKYLKADFPEMDYIKSVTIVSESDAVSGPTASAAPADAKPAPTKPVEAATAENSDLIKRATSLKKRMCACKDRDCTRTVSKDAMAMNAEFMKATPAEKTAMRKLGGEMSACIMKVRAADAPPAAKPAAKPTAKGAPAIKVAPAGKKAPAVRRPTSVKAAPAAAKPASK